ncbi:MAG: LysR family transcriptional regulator [Burkholderiaceae bacterium]|jgi:LysR family carnitine catabolism transcriptional activator
MVNNIRYRQLKAFCLAVEEGSFHAAARVLCVSNPAFTALIKNLENDLGVQLFIRTTRNGSLTPEGQGLYDAMSHVLFDLEEVYQYAKDVGSGVRGKLSIAAVPSIALGFLTQVLGAFHRLYPGVHLYLSEHSSDQVLEAVRANHVEIGIGRQPNESGFQFVHLFDDHLLVAAPQNHALARHSALDWAALADQRVIMIGGGATAQQLEVRYGAKSHPVEVTHLATAVALVKNGLGVAVIPSSVSHALDADGVRFISLRGEGAVRSVGAIYKKRRKLSARAQQFLALAVPMAAAKGTFPLSGTTPSSTDPGHCQTHACRPD